MRAGKTPPIPPIIEEFRDKFKELDIDVNLTYNDIVRYDDKGMLTDFGTFMVYSGICETFRTLSRQHRVLLKNHERIVDHFLDTDRETRAITIAQLRNDLQQMVEWIDQQTALCETVCKQVLSKVEIMSKAMTQKFIQMKEEDSDARGEGQTNQ